MAVPRAHPGGMFDSGVFPQAPHQIDVAGLINAAAGGASSLLHGAYLRKMGMMNYQLQLRRLEQEGELHKAQLEAISEYRKTALGLRGQAIAAPDARKTKANQQAFSALQKEFPGHPSVAPDENGEAPVFDPQQQGDYVGDLKAARGQKAASDKELAVHADRLDTLQKSGELRARLQKSGIQLRAAAAADKPPSAAQTLRQKSDLLKHVGDLSEGDADKAQALIENDPDIAAAVGRLGVSPFEVRAAAKAVQAKKDAASAAAGARAAANPLGGTPTEQVKKIREFQDASRPAPAATGAPTVPITPLATPGATPKIDKNTTATYDENGVPTLDFHTPAAAVPAPLRTPNVGPPAPATTTTPIRPLLRPVAPGAPAAVPPAAAPTPALLTPGRAAPATTPAAALPLHEHYDAAAAQLKAAGLKDDAIAAKLGPRPPEPDQEQDEE